MKKLEKSQKNFINLGISASIVVGAVIYPQVSHYFNTFDQSISTSATLEQLESSGITFDITTWSNPFQDVKEEDWYYNSVGFVQHTGLMDGTSEHIFSPNLSVSRGLFVTTLYNYVGNPETSGSNPFKDIESDSLEDAVIWASEAGILPDIYSKKFYPDEEITREEVATIIYKFQLYQGGKSFTGSVPSGFTDISQLSFWAYEGVGWCVKEILIHGKNDNILDPKSPINKAEFSLILEKYHKTVFPTNAVKNVEEISVSAIEQAIPEDEQELVDISDVTVEKLSSDLSNDTEDKGEIVTIETEKTDEKEVEIVTEEPEKEEKATTTTIDTTEEITATITGSSSVRIYDRPSSSASIFTSFPKGLEVAVRGVSNGGKWYQVADGGTIGYVTKDYLDISADDVEKLSKLHSSFSAYIPEEMLTSIYEAPSKSSSRLLTVREGSLVTVIHTMDDWYQTDLGYVEKKYVQLISTKEYQAINAEVSVPEVDTTPTSKELGVEIATYAQRFLGYPYKSGGTTINGFNCVGFTKYIYGKFGIDLAHSASSQYKMGEYVKKSNLRAGDLLFFGNLSHAAIYIGNNKLIHASSSSGKVVISDMSGSYYVNNYYGARRLV